MQYPQAPLRSKGILKWKKPPDPRVVACSMICSDVSFGLKKSKIFTAMEPKYESVDLWFTEPVSVSDGHNIHSLENDLKP